MRKAALLLFFTSILFSCKDQHEKLKDGLYAEIKTNKGIILMQLEFEKAPISVANFVTLAEGKNNFVSEDYKGKKFFDGLIFHRVESDFVIQGGDPDGNGSGGPGYIFRNENSDLKYNKEGVVGMANSGLNTNGSQFFITLNTTPNLDGGYTIFAQVVENGMNIVKKIEIGDQMQAVKIIRKGEAAKKFDAVKIFSDFFVAEQENLKKQALIDAENAKKNELKNKAIRDKKIAEFNSLKVSGTKSSTGLIYKFTQKGSGKKPASGTTVFVDYAGFLEDGSLFDTSIESVAQAFGKFDQNRADAKQYVPFPFQYGRKDGLISGFLEGLNKMSIGDKILIYIPTHLGYGEAGAGPVPANANLIFEVELKEKQ